MAETRQGGRHKDIPVMHRGASPVPVQFGDIGRAPLPNRRRHPLIKPGDLVPISLDMDQGPLSADEIIRIEALRQALAGKDAAVQGENDKPKFRVVGGNRLLLSTPDINNPDLRTESTTQRMRVRLTSNWARDPETGLLYVSAGFVNFVYGKEVGASEAQMNRDRSLFLREHQNFFFPESGRPNEEADFSLAYRPSNGKGADGHWISSVYD